MIYQSTIEIGYAAACLVLILAGLFCSIVRWFHLCRPYDKENADYCYPARLQVTFFFAAIALQFPYLFHPMDTDIWTYVRLFGIIYYPMCFSMMYLRYFYLRRAHYNWIAKLFFWVPTSIIVCLLTIVTLFHDHNLLERCGTSLLYIMGISSLTLTARFIYVVHLLRKKIAKFHDDNFSNEKDFPYRFAEQVLYIPLLWIIAMWVIFLTGSHEIKMYVDVLFGFSLVAILPIILHPQRIPEQEEVPDAVHTHIQVEKTVLAETYRALSPTDIPNSPATKTDRLAERKVIKREVLDIIRRRYQEPNLRKTDVISEIDYGRKTIASEILTELGFYDVVNSFRFEHARLYQEANPKATKEQIAEAAGFGDRFTYYRALKKGVQILDEEVLREFHITP